MAGGLGGGYSEEGSDFEVTPNKSGNNVVLIHNTNNMYRKQIPINIRINAVLPVGLKDAF